MISLVSVVTCLALMHLRWMHYFRSDRFKYEYIYTVTRKRWDHARMYPLLSEPSLPIQPGDWWEHVKKKKTLYSTAAQSIIPPSSCAPSHLETIFPPLMVRCRPRDSSVQARMVVDTDSQDEPGAANAHLSTGMLHWQNKQSLGTVSVGKWALHTHHIRDNGGQ